MQTEKLHNYNFDVNQFYGKAVKEEYSKIAITIYIKNWNIKTKSVCLQLNC